MDAPNYSSEIKLESTSHKPIGGRSLPNPNMPTDPNLYVTYPILL